MNPRPTRRLSTSPLTRRLGGVAALVAMALTVAPPVTFAQNNTKATRTINVLPMSITSVTVVNGALVATGAVGSNVFTAPVTLALDPHQPGGGACPVLDLSLGPIHLTLLGLKVDTSAICLKITAHQGGGLLGDLLCSIGTQLTGGLSLSGILANLTTDNLALLNTGLTSLLNQAVFTPLTSSSAVTGATCNILNLSLGPLDLNLLGLEVALDNCNNGPITLDITATQNGGLLGSLLCDLSGLLSNPNASLSAIVGKLRDIAAAIGQLVG